MGGGGEIMTKKIKIPSHQSLRKILYLLRMLNFIFLIGWVLFAVSLSTNAKESSELDESSVTLMDPSDQKKFINNLPIPKRLDARHGGKHIMPIRQTKVWMGLENENNNRLETIAWGFAYKGKIYTPGPTILAKKDTPITVNWQNHLPHGPHLFPVDKTLHIPEIKKEGELPTVIHLHGGHTEADSDGNPLAWYTQGYDETGPDFVKRNYRYDNDQEAATLWYHDHVIGMTRLNVYAGLYGFYLITDDNEQQLLKDGILPPQSKTIEMVLNDALFTDQGQLYYPGYHGEPISPVLPKPIEDNYPNPSHMDEFFGNFILVNNMVWPKVDVEPSTYRFRLLNGASSRSFILKFKNDMPFYQISSDGGFLNKPVRLTELVLAPAERADIIVDFSQYPGEKIILQNKGPEIPFRGYVDPNDPEHSEKIVYNKTGNMAITDGKGGIVPSSDPETTGLIMRFDVSGQTSAPVGVTSKPSDHHASTTNTSPLTEATPLRKPIEYLQEKDAVKVRKLTLFRLDDPDGRTVVLLGTLDGGSFFYADPVTEVIENNTTEIWEIYNATASAHPIHIHLVQFELLDRQPYDGEVLVKRQQFMHTDKIFDGAKLKLNGLTGKPIVPEPNEQGLKDTVLALSGQVTRVIAHFDRAGQYVWHCHIITHEDYDMMRPLVVVDSDKVDAKEKIV